MATVVMGLLLRAGSRALSCGVRQSTDYYNRSAPERKQVQMKQKHRIQHDARAGHYKTRPEPWQVKRTPPQPIVHGF